MNLINWVRNNRQEQWILYSWNKDYWEECRRYVLSGQQAVYQLAKSCDRRVQFAVIGLNLSYRNTLYALMPSIQVIIPPKQLFEYTEHFYKLPEGCSDEVAVGMDHELTEQWEETMDFLHSLYSCSSLKEACQFYEAWQLKRSLRNRAADKLQLVIEIFKDEIFNYFSCRELLGKVPAFCR